MIIPDGGGEVEAAVEVSEAAIGGEAAAAAAEEAACATTSIWAALMSCWNLQCYNRTKLFGFSKPLSRKFHAYKSCC